MNANQSQGFWSWYLHRQQVQNLDERLLDFDDWPSTDQADRVNYRFELPPKSFEMEKEIHH